jgi:hypothetical protein
MGKPTQRRWSMKDDRELIALAKSETLEAIARQMQRPPETIIKRAATLGHSIKGRKRAPPARN